MVLTREEAVRGFSNSRRRIVRYDVRKEVVRVLFRQVGSEKIL